MPIRTACRAVPAISAGWLLAAALVLPAAAAAAEGSADAAAPLAHAAPFIAVSVADLDKQLAWYTETLGFRLHSRGELPGRGIRFALLKSGAALIELLQVPDARPRTVVAPSAQEASRIHGFFKAGVVVPDVDAVYQALKAKGVTFAIELGKPPGAPYRVFGVNDPEGNLLQIFGV